MSSNLIRCSISYGIGCLLYRHFISNPQLAAPSRASSNLSGLGILALFILIVLNLTFWQRPFSNHWDWIFVLFIFPSFTYFALRPGTILNKILSSKPFVFLGTISYSVYLMHVQAALLLSFVERHLGKQWIPLPYQGICYLLITIGAATLTYWFIEVPSRRALREKLEPFLRKIFFDRY